MMKRLSSGAPLSDAMAGVPRTRLKSLISTAGFALAILSALAAVSAGLGNGLGWWNYRIALSILPWTAYGGAAAVVLSLLGILWPRRGSTRLGLIFALAGLGLGRVVFGYPYTMRSIARSVPPIHDITTDTENPPAFVAILPLREAAHASNPATYGGPEIARQQQTAYPNIKPAHFNALPAQVFEAALATAKDQGWDIVAAVPDEGRIETTATTFWFHFKDDVVIRIAPDGQGTRLDIRSESRVGRNDVGANARRIAQYLAALNHQMGGR